MIKLVLLAIAILLFLWKFGKKVPDEELRDAQCIKCGIMTREYARRHPVMFRYTETSLKECKEKYGENYDPMIYGVKQELCCGLGEDDFKELLGDFYKNDIRFSVKEDVTRRKNGEVENTTYSIYLRDGDMNWGKEMLKKHAVVCQLPINHGSFNTYTVRKRIE